MTGQQLELAKEEQRKAGASWEDGAELRCIGMMHSILVYDYFPEQENFPFPANNRYLQDYIDEIGMERAEQLWQEQVADFRKAKVGRNVWTDSEGCSYNTCRWADDKPNERR